MLRYLALLPCLVMVVELTAVPRSAPNGSCQRLLQCQDTIEESAVFAESGNMLAYASETEVMETVCGELSTLTSCVTEHQDVCNDDTIKHEAKAVKDIIEYMCTPAGRQLILSLADTDCASNPLMEVRFETMMQTCLETFQFDVQMEALDYAFSGREPELSAFCPFVTQLRTCLVRGAQGMCGSQWGTFIGNIWDIASRDQFSEFGCTSGMSAKRRALKRALPMVLKRANIVNKLKK